MAFRRVVETGKSKPVRGKLVDVRCIDFASVTTKVGKPKIIDHHDNDIGALLRLDSRAKGEKGEKEQKEILHRTD